MQKYYDWLRQRVWPILLIPAVLTIYLLLRNSLSVSSSSLNTWYGVTLQILGGFQLIWSIDANLRGFKGQTILQAIKRDAVEFFSSFPLWSKTNTTIITGTGSMTLAGAQAKLRVSNIYTDLTQRVEFLERQIVRIEDMIDNRIEDLNSKVDEQKRDIQSQFAAASTTSADLKNLITDVAVGGIRGQITGFLIVVIGTIISAIQ